MANIFEDLNKINVNEHTESRNGLTYLSWAWAYAEVKKRYPEASYKVYENETVGLPYFTDGKTCMVKVSVTINDMEIIEWLPIMDFRNKSIPVESVTSMDINKAIQRALTKATARHGLGLYIYAGEDLPEEEATEAKKQAVAKRMELIDAKTAEVLGSMLVKKGINVDKLMAQYKVGKVEELNAEQYGDILRRLNEGASK